jgi:hypothetical protein
VWLIPGVVAAAGHVLLVPLYFASRWWDLSRQPFGFGHWPGESGWPAGSGSSEWGPGVAFLIVIWLLLVIGILCASLLAGLLAVLRRTGAAR